MLWTVVKTIDMEPMPDIEEDMSDIPVEAAAEVVLDIAMSIVDDDMCDISIMANEELTGCSEDLVAQRGRFSGCVDLREQFSRMKEN